MFLSPPFTTACTTGLSQLLRGVFHFLAEFVLCVQIAAQQGLGVAQVFENFLAGALGVPFLDEVENAFVAVEVALQVVHEREYTAASFGHGVIHHAHGGLDGDVLGGLKNAFVESDLVDHEALGIVKPGAHAREGFLHFFDVVLGGAPRCKSRGRGFQDLPQFQEFEVLDLLKEQHPLEVAADDSAERWLDVGAVSRAGSDESEEDQTLQSFAQGASTDVEHGGEFGFGGQAAAAAKFATAHQSLDATGDHFHDRLPADREELRDGDVTIDLLSHNPPE